MPITDLDSYVPTADEFIVHGTNVDADRAANSLPPIKMRGGFTIANLQTLRDEADEAIDIEPEQNVLELAIGLRDNQKEVMAEKLRQFRSALELHMIETAYMAAAPRMPSMTSAESKFLKPFRDMKDLWPRIDAATDIPDFTGPLLLREGLAVAEFVTQFDLMETRFKTVTEAEGALKLARKKRDKLLKSLVTRLRQYIRVIELEYGKEHEFYLSLPALEAPPGSTPVASVLSGHWEPTSQAAVLNWTESADPNLQEYELRVSPGPTYQHGTSSVAGNFPPGTSGTMTLAGLANPGDVASFKVFVRLTTGNSAGSNKVTITRPGS